MAIQKRVPTDDQVVAVEFSLSDPEYPFVGASAVEDARVVLEEVIPRSDGEYAEFFSVTGTDPDTIVDIAEGHGYVDPTLLSRYEDGGLFEFSVDGQCPVVHLGEHGALARDVYSVAGEGHIRAEIPAQRDASAIVDRFLDDHPDATLISKRAQPYSTSIFSQREFAQAVEETLTDRQQEVLAMAHELGYYQWPRETSGEELAEELDISAATLHQHLRTAEQKLISVLFSDPRKSA